MAFSCYFICKFRVTELTDCYYRHIYALFYLFGKVDVGTIGIFYSRFTALVGVTLDRRVVKTYSRGNIHAVYTVLDKFLRKYSALDYRVSSEHKFFRTYPGEDRKIRTDKLSDFFQYLKVDEHPSVNISAELIGAEVGPS